MIVLEEETNWQALMAVGISGQQQASEMFEKIKEGVYTNDTKSKKERDIEVEYICI